MLTLPDAVDWSAVSTDDLKQQLADCLTMTARALARASEIYMELERRGVDLHAVRTGIGYYLPRIARGELTAEAVIAFAGQRVVLQRMVGMPPEEQRRLAAGGHVTIAVRTETGEIRAVERNIAELSAREAIQAIDSGRVRPIESQIKTVAAAVVRPSSPTRRSGSRAKIRADRSSGQIVIGAIRIDPHDLTSALRQLGLQLLRIDPGEGA